MKPLPLTIVTAVLNEEKQLDDFLSYARQVAQEVIVVIDYRTTDRSKEIAQNHAVRVLQDTGSSKGNVFNNKNMGIKLAKQEWVLVLDADERLDETLTKEIHAIVMAKNDNKMNMYMTGFINFEFGKYFEQCDQKNKPFIRLFRNGTFTYNTSSTTEGWGIHKNAVGTSFIFNLPLIRSLARRKNPKIQTMKGYILHNSHPTIDVFIEKINRYSTREAKVKFEHNADPSLLSLVISMLFQPVKEFMYKYIVWRMYIEGLHGFIASVIYAFYHFLIFAKYFALVYQSKNR
ncbi:glycosyltransferase [Candidatus Woesebacteria bacterium]|nr:glycosyltransferase [Candidatus Woesebacteria bacterium]